MIGLHAVYIFGGLVFTAVAVLSARDKTNGKRWANAIFWGLFALSFLAGDVLGDFGNGLLVLAMVLIAGTVGIGVGRPATTSPEQRRMGAKTFRNYLFVPALVIPAITLTGALTFKSIHIGEVALFDPAQVTLVALTIGVVVALLLARVLLREPVVAAFQEGRVLIDL